MWAWGPQALPKPSCLSYGGGTGVRLGSSGKGRTEGGGRQMVSVILSGQCGEVRPWGTDCAQGGAGPSILRMLRNSEIS
jgi:hypothetical protein